MLFCLVSGACGGVEVRHAASANLSGNVGGSFGTPTDAGVSSSGDDADGTTIVAQGAPSKADGSVAAPKPTCSSASGAINLSLIASRTSGVAPLSVFFDATATTAKGTTRPFHDLEYRWDFGDKASGRWSTTSLSRNLATGPLAAHVFETPGTYTVQLTVFDGHDTASAGCAQITVTDPDVVFAGQNTTCFSTSGNFAGCPAGAQQMQTASFATVTGAAGPGRRLLMRRGESWDAAATGLLKSAGPGLLGAFGTGAAPIVRATGNMEILKISSHETPGFSDVRVMDLELDGLSGASSLGVSAAGGANQVTLLRLNIHDAHWGINFDPEALNYLNAHGFPGHVIYDQLAIVGCTVAKSGSYGAYLGARRFAFLGNVITDTTVSPGMGQHLLRATGLDQAVISDNSFSKTEAMKNALKLHAPGAGTNGVLGALSQQILISDNHIAGADNDWTVGLGPQNASSDERMRDVVIERNWFTSGAGSQVALMIWAVEVTVRNNIFDLTGARSNTGIVVERRGIEPAPDQVRLLNNTFYNGSAGALTGMVLRAPAMNVTAVNNLASGPTASGSMVVDNSAGAAPVVLSNNQLTTSAGFARAAPSAAADFKVTASSPAIDVGTAVPVYSDFAGTSRPRGKALDLGAFEL